jgi:tRNA(Ile)-lysidine synthase
MLTERVAAFIERELLLAPRQKVVVGVSGGPDSLCLLHCLCALGYAPLAAHLDHRLRPHSWRDAQTVLRVARRLGVPAVVQRLQPGSLKDTPGSLEEAARAVRYQFLVEEARRWGTDRIATGHTADDQAETVVMHFLRGAGVSGLGGMRPRTPMDTWSSFETTQDVELVRPLLEIRRDQTVAYCREVGLRPRQDPTNRDTTFRRNRIRHELLPSLATYNPGIVDVLQRTSRVMQEADEWTAGQVRAAVPRVVIAAEPRAVVLQRKAFLAEPAPIQAGLVASAARHLRPGLRDFGFEAVEAFRTFVARAGQGHRIQLPGGLELVDEGDVIRLMRLGEAAVVSGWPQLVSASGERLPVPGRLDLQAGAAIYAGEPEVPPRDVRGAGPGLAVNAWVDASRLSEPLTVRPPRPGDRMRPLGMRGRRKIADVFNSMRIPPPARAMWPVIWSGERVVWLVGLRIGDDFRLESTTREGIRLQLKGLEYLP